MDTKKILLLILVVIAILTAMFIGVGFRRETTYTQKEDGPFSGFDRSIAKRFRDPFDTTRVSGCGWNGQGFQLGTGECAILIAPGKERSSAFELIPTAGDVRARFGFEPDKLSEWTRLVKNQRRFVVSKDSAFLQLNCAAIGGNLCTIRLSREE
jgi:hypothetical protein